MEKIISKLGELNTVIENEKPIFFGAGKVTYYMLKYVSGLSFVPRYILVSSKYRNPSNILWIPIKAMYELHKDFIENNSVLVCTSEKWHREIENVLQNYDFLNVFYISDELIKEITFNNTGFDIENNIGINGLRNELAISTKQLMRFIPKPCLEYMILHIVDHCNLRCYGCDHFACIADENYISYDAIHRDIERMAKIFGGDYILKIAVMGGEPLLHPDLCKILRDVRCFFPYTTIRLSTNGVLLLRQNKEFWTNCRENDVEIVITKYPINLEFDKMMEIANYEKVRIRFHEGSDGDYVKRSFKKRINLEEDSNPVYSFADCHISNYGNQLLEGKFYGCAFSCQSYRIFNRKFNQNLRLTEDDYIDIYKTDDKEDFFRFAARPKYYCRYCAGVTEEFPWSLSKGEMTEWIDENGIPNFYKSIF